jgi:hypothetical protein
MPSIYDNGGMIGSDLYFRSTDQYEIGTTTGLATPQYVGGQGVNLVGTTSSTNITFALTGGIAATPSTDDIVILVFGTASNTDRRATIFPVKGSDAANYTQISSTYVNGTNDTNAFFGYKFMGATPDTGINLPAGTGNAADGGGVTIHVWRGISTSSPLEGGTKATSGGSTALANPPAASINTAGAITIVATASGHTGGSDTYSSTQLSNFINGSGSDTFDSSVGMGSYSGAGPFDPSPFTFTQADSTAFSSVAYTQTFTPATINIPVYGNLKNSGIWSIKSTGYKDPNFKDVSLLLKGNGASGGTVFTDSSLNNLTVTPSGNAVTSTSIKKYGTASMFFDGTGDYLTTPYNVALDLVASNFTIEAWIYPTNLKANGIRVFSIGGGTVGWNATTGIHVLLQLTSTGRVDFQIASGGATPRSALSTASVSINTWSHIAVSFISPTSVILFVNGVAESFTILAPSRPSTNPTTTVATIPGEAGAVSIAFQGYIDDLRVTKDIARYNQTFIPPTEILL